jgi:alkylation response protein AidB-like acyl-CoA dehydrogenase
MYRMEKYFWWNEKQKSLADEAAQFSDAVIAPRIREIERTKRFPWEFMSEIGKKGWFGILIPEAYGGMGEDYGTTGMCIVLEEIARGAAVAVDFYETTIYGYSPIVRFGTEEQKGRFLPGLATGERFACIAITEPFCGSDAAAVQTTAVLDGDDYVINGRKRFITVGGVGNLYCVYCKTSDSPDDRARHRHMSAILVEKGMPGFSVEAIHDVMGRFGSRHAALRFDNVRVPRENLILNEGDGWRVLADALNIERLGVAAGAIGVARSSLAETSNYASKRVQFGKTLSEIPAIQFMGSDMVTSIILGHTQTYYTACMLDSGRDVPIGASVAKLYTTDTLMKTTLDAVQCHGGDGYTTQYPVERHMRDSKLIQIGAGSNEILRTLIWKQWQKEVRAFEKAERRPAMECSLNPEEARGSIMESLAEDYKRNPGLYMRTEDLQQKFGLGDEALDHTLKALEAEGFVALHRVRNRITLAKATYQGLDRTKPKEYYLSIPDFVDREKEVF